MNKEGKPVSASRITTTHETMPADGNNAGKYFGGNMMRLMDLVGYYSAVRHARTKLVTVALNMSFHAPVEIGILLVCHASVNAVWSKSMEVGVRVESEEPISGERRHVASAYLTFVGLDADGRPTELPHLILESAEDRRRFAEATRRSAVSRLEKKGDPASMGLLNLEVLPGSYAVHRLPKDAPLPDLSCLDATNFVNICRAEDEVSLILDEDAAKRLCSVIPAIESKCCYACIKVNEKDMINKVGMLASLSTLLASVEVPLVTVATYETFCVLLENKHLDMVIERLSIAGHKVTIPPLPKDS